VEGGRERMGEKRRWKRKKLRFEQFTAKSSKGQRRAQIHRETQWIIGGSLVQMVWTKFIKLGGGRWI